MSQYNVLLFRQGGTLYLDEALPGQPSACTITLTSLNTNSLTSLGGGFVDVQDEECDVWDLVVALPAKSPPWKTVVPTSTTGTIGDMTAEGRRFLLNRGGRKRWVRVSEFDVGRTEVIDIEGTHIIDIVTELRFDEGIDFALKVGDALKDVRCSYNVDWSGVTGDFVGRVKATWKVTVEGTVLTFVKVYDVVRQILFCPATWSDVLKLRPELDNEISQVADKEKLVIQAWEDIVVALGSMGIRHNLIVPDGSTILRDATVRQCIINLTQYHGLMTPAGYIGQTDDYIEMLEASKGAILNKFILPVDNDQNGLLSEQEQYGTKRQVWFRRPNRSKGRG